MVQSVWFEYAVDYGYIVKSTVEKNYILTSKFA